MKQNNKFTGSAKSLMDGIAYPMETVQEKIDAIGKLDFTSPESSVDRLRKFYNVDSHKKEIAAIYGIDLFTTEELLKHFTEVK
jgi:hypothetical protein